MKMYKNKIRIGIILILSLLFMSSSFAYAAPSSAQVIKEYLDDGSYFETVITSSSTRSTIRNASKTTTYKNADGEALWDVKVTANFEFNGSTSKCTSAVASANSYNKVWKILDKRSNRNGNSGSATALAGSYLGGVFVGSMSKTVTLTCDKNGNLS